MQVASQSQNNLPAGAQTPQATQGDYNQVMFAVMQAQAKLKTNTIVKVLKCTNNGGLSAVGYVDVLPMINQVDSSGKGVPHVTLYGIPYLRIQGGTNAIIIDPKPGDIGICSFASRDISKVKATKAAANPGSERKFSFSDGMYHGGILNGNPAQYMQFQDTGITILSPNKVTINGNNIEVNSSGPCLVTASGDISVHSDSQVNVTGSTINLN